MIVGKHKILTGIHGAWSERQALRTCMPPYVHVPRSEHSPTFVTGSACWMGPHYPNGTVSPKCSSSVNCGAGCLFDIFADPYEYTDLAKNPTPENNATLTLLKAKLADANTRFFNPKRGGNTDNLACKVAASRGGYYGPFLP